ncbi:DUF4156 domain-containing protein [Aliivibrio finisterrensis]|uniref:DUF4156 domain-containing protein n=1 Tax=Aliivibrio finisterrensis TaxID=511998 RepID=UPI0010206C8D|nr:DUF4156 domain-containing protein [Aliivibrio finisterrensis]RYU69465.1 DUF4156 domain-containing protein [Aliivibrio finisterrensis]RYU73263.1 DUF4156 domain-containing protein [Aliivibrio finisterrensis]RYU76217.1 DUF4156 domain-containing protein [Aliivibrio finisterrensis]
MKLFLSALLSLTLLSGCALTTQPIDTESEAITLYYNDSIIQAQKCMEVGTVTGSEGHWYTFFFISNKDLMIAAVNDIKNEAQALNANTIVLQEPMAFNTSVTMLGSAYICP